MSAEHGSDGVEDAVAEEDIGTGPVFCPFRGFDYESKLLALLVFLGHFYFEGLRGGGVEGLDGIWIFQFGAQTRCSPQ